MKQFILGGLVLLGLCAVLFAEEPQSEQGIAQVSYTTATQFTAQDTLNLAAAAASTDQQECLNGLCWSPTKFEVSVTATPSQKSDYQVQFPSPVTSPYAVNNQVTLEWYQVRDEQGQPLERPAFVVVHESGSNMAVGRLFAESFHKQGYHAFLLHLPGYGNRNWGSKPQPAELLVLLRQGIADVRRARDAVAALPSVDSRVVVLQGTSLGGIVSATVAGLDHGYDGVFLMLAGGDLYSIIQNGQRDAARMREQLEAAGVTQEEIRQMALHIEPNRLASRVKADRLWLYSGKYDTVIPLANAESFSLAGQLTSEHHIIMPVNHYSGMLYLPLVLSHINEQVQAIQKSL